MKVWNFTENDNGTLITPECFGKSASGGRAVALGYFDGVHAGHREILGRLRGFALEREIPAMVHTFVSMPKSKKTDINAKKNAHLTTVSEKCCFFEQLGVDETALFPFSKAISSMRSRDFLNHHIKDLLRAKVVVAGEDYRFGRDREGDITLLSSWGRENGIEVFSVPPILHMNKVISSTWIRDCVRNGQMTLAETLLGCPISYSGIVQEGKQLGRTLGFPTANMTIDSDKVIPAFGVYASVLVRLGAAYPSITSVGLRPTVNTKDLSPLIETMMYDHSMDLYGQKIRVYLISYIRPEYRFPDVHALKEQVHKDMNEVRHFHDVHGYDYSNLLSCVI